MQIQEKVDQGIDEHLCQMINSGAPRARSTIVKKIWKPIDVRKFGFIAMTSSTSVRTYVRTPFMYANVTSTGNHITG